MVASHALMSSLERYALASLEKQDKLEALIGDSLHELDLDAGRLRFNAFAFPMQVLGTESDNTLTWLWAWADEQTDIPEALLQDSLRLKIWGAQAGVPEFTAPSVDLAAADGHAMALIAAQVSRASCFFADHYEGGAAYLLLSDRIIDEQPPFDRDRLLRRMSDLFSRYELDQRAALRSYLELKEIAFTEGENLINAELDSRERLNAEFDDTGRLVMVNGAVFEY